MTPTELLQEIRKMRFEKTFSIWTEGRITQEEAARMLNVSSRTFQPIAMAITIKRAKIWPQISKFSLQP
jgi:hypothetical protein